MSSHEYEAPVDVPAEQLFEYVADPAHLPEFLTVVAEAHTTGPDQVHVEADVEGRHVDTETWFHADPATRTLRWGAPGRRTTAVSCPCTRSRRTGPASSST
ncbi:hypothetical protein ACFQV2_14410 [Actinokineospora soli]|uniref:Polyketide cyclase / dehydrase and lipid transport n=1 Tax=Actinokineospora soli TaxID=1048753 RepID=A0ABW2TLA5_9PSEU